MNDEEREGFIKMLREYTDKLSKYKELAGDFLIRTGIYTEEGILAEPYKHLHFPQPIEA